MCTPRTQQIRSPHGYRILSSDNNRFFFFCFMRFFSSFKRTSHGLRRIQFGFSRAVKIFHRTETINNISRLIDRGRARARVHVNCEYCTIMYIIIITIMMYLVSKVMISKYISRNTRVKIIS